MNDNITLGKIDGVKIKALKVWQDKPDLKQDVEPGVFAEILRDDDNLLTRFGQSNFTTAPKDTIKAFHWHKYQDDLWFFATGRVGVVMYDRRDDSPTHGITEVIYSGENDYKVILIPQGVVHGYKVLSDEISILIYHVTKAYDRDKPDEERIDPFDKTINFNWDSLE
jgi:dTDP-4-dehydrorhamnose 3,5-epimerase